MFLGSPRRALDDAFAWLALAATFGIGASLRRSGGDQLVSSSRSSMPSWRAPAGGRCRAARSRLETLICRIGGIGLALLYFGVNALTMWLTLATFVGYAIIYTVVLKPLRRRTSSSAAPRAPCRPCWAGRRDRRHCLRSADPVPHHLRLDAAAFLGARAVSQDEYAKGRRAHAARHPRRQFTRCTSCCIR